jgi:hypothetical protein
MGDGGLKGVNLFAPRVRIFRNMKITLCYKRGQGTGQTELMQI